MRRSFFLFLALMGALALANCGGGSPTSTPTGTHISLTPSVVSLVPGQVALFTAQERDSTNTALSKQPTITFTVAATSGCASGQTCVTTNTANCSIAGVTGCEIQVCAGTFDPSFVNCTPGPVPVQVSVTAAGDNLTTSASMFIHQTVTGISITPNSTSGCVSSGGTETFAATAAHNGADITASVGPITWSTTSSSVVTIDNNGVATAASPGSAAVLATVAQGNAGQVSSLPATFNTCAVQTISFHVSGAPDTSFNTTFPSTTQQQLAVDVIDSNGKSITASGLTFTVVPNALGTSSGTAFNPSMGGTGAIVASCQPPGCNVNINYDVFSNPVIANVSGTVAGSVWVASSSGTALVAIPLSSNTPGTPITLPAMPNSLIVGSGQKNAYLGSANGLLVVNLSNSTVTTVSGAPGKVLAVDPGENRAIVANGTNVFVVTISGSAVQTLQIGGATAASWTPDGFQAYIAAGNNVIEYSPQFSPKQVSVSSPVADVAFLTNGQFAYFAQGSGVAVRRPCDNSQVDNVTTSGPPQKIKTTTNNSAVFAVDSNGSTTGVDVITPTITSPSGCGQAVTNVTKFRDFKAGIFTPTEAITTPDSNYLFAIGSGTLLAYNATQDQTSSIALAGNAMPLAGDAILDSSSLYIGASDGNVHQLKIANGTVTDAAQIAVSSIVGGNPDLVMFVQR